MWHLGRQFSGRLGSVKLVVGLDGLKGLFQLKSFYNSMILPILYQKESPSNILSCVSVNIQMTMSRKRARTGKIHSSTLTSKFFSTSVICANKKYLNWRINLHLMPNSSSYVLPMMTPFSFLITCSYSWPHHYFINKKVSNSKLFGNS